MLIVLAKRLRLRAAAALTLAPVSPVLTGGEKDDLAANPMMRCS
jgi:hypothetical protein